MSLFSKEKGIVLNLLNAVLVIWVLGAIIATISNLTPLLIKEHVYSYEEYQIAYCNFEYETEEECKNNYTAYKLDSKYYNTEYKRGIIISITNVILVSTTIVLLNVTKNKKTD